MYNNIYCVICVDHCRDSGETLRAVSTKYLCGSALQTPFTLNVLGLKAHLFFVFFVFFIN